MSILADIIMRDHRRGCRKEDDWRIRKQIPRGCTGICSIVLKDECNGMRYYVTDVMWNLEIYLPIPSKYLMFSYPFEMITDILDKIVKFDDIELLFYDHIPDFIDDMDVQFVKLKIKKTHTYPTIEEVDNICKTAIKKMCAY